MIDIQRILCPIDFSEPSLEALDTARGMALRFGAELHLMHCVEPIRVPTPPTATIDATVEPVDVTGYERHVMETATAALDDLARKNETQDLKIHTHVTDGRPQDEIVECAREIRAGLMVVSTHGTSGLRRFLFGSVADKIIRTAPCPVLVITPETGN